MLLLSAFFMSCEEEVNQWANEGGSFDRLFKPLVFDVVNANATSVELKYTKSISADKYIFEFSEDSLEFNEIVLREEVLADTLTPFSSSGTETRTEYRSLFGVLKGTTSYSVRMYVLNEETGLQSELQQRYFETAAEQLFTSYLQFTNKIELTWMQVDNVTNIVVTNRASGEVVVDKALSAEEIAGAAIVFDGLVPGTAYNFSIYNGSNIRGSLDLKTSGLSGSTIIPVTPTDDVASLILSAVNAGSSNITLAFDGNETYDIGNLAVPGGVTNISFTGVPGTGGVFPTMNLREVRFAELIFEDVVFENVNLDVESQPFLLYLNDDNLDIGNLIFRNSTFKGFQSVIRASNKMISVKSISFDDCIVQNNGGWGVVNIGGNDVSTDTISFTNSTFLDLQTQLVDVRNQPAYFYVGNCTFVNLNIVMSYVLRFEVSNLPPTVVCENNIIAGDNAGGKLNALSYNQEGRSLFVSWGGCYITNDVEINQYPFENITAFNGSTYDLFVDPDNGDFSIDPSIGFGGYGVAGDPRWFDQ